MRFHPVVGAVAETIVEAAEGAETTITTIMETITTTRKISITQFLLRISAETRNFTKTLLRTKKLHSIL